MRQPTSRQMAWQDRQRKQGRCAHCGKLVRTGYKTCKENVPRVGPGQKLGYKRRVHDSMRYRNWVRKRLIYND